MTLSRLARCGVLLLLAAAVLPWLSGCRTWRVRPGVEGFALTPAEDAQAQALAHFAKGTIYEAELGRNSPEALAEFEKAAALDPREPRLYSRVAIAALQRELPAKATAALEQLCRELPNSFQARFDLATVYQATGNTELAVENYLKALAIDPSNAVAYLPPAKLLIQESRDQRAVDLLRKGYRSVRDAGPLSGFAFSSARMLLERGQPARALLWFQMLADHDRERRREFLHICGELQEAAGDLSAAQRSYEMAIAMPPPLAMSYLKLAQLRAKTHLSRAIQTLVEADVAIPQEGQILHQLGEYYEEAGRDADAFRAYQQACDSPRPQAQSFLKIALAQVRTNALQAVATLTRAEQKLPGDLLVLAALAHMHALANQPDGAIAAYERLLQSPAADGGQRLTTQFYLLYGSTCERAGRFADAERVFELGVARYPDAHPLLNYLAYMWAERGVNLDKALGYVSRALKEDPANGAYLDTLGWIYFKKGDPAKAQEYVRQADAVMPDDATILDHLGDVQQALANPAQAVELWKRSLAIEPDNAAVQKKLQAAGVDVRKFLDGLPKR